MLLIGTFVYTQSIKRETTKWKPRYVYAHSLGPTSIVSAPNNRYCASHFFSSTSTPRSSASRYNVIL